MRSQGWLRQWTNGNLQALLEPTAAGHRVRLKTTKQNAVARIVVGTGIALVSAGIALAESSVEVMMPALLFFGAGIAGVTALRLPGWARTRTRQMEEAIGRLLAASRGGPRFRLMDW